MGVSEGARVASSRAESSARAETSVKKSEKRAPRQARAKRAPWMDHALQVGVATGNPLVRNYHQWCCWNLSRWCVVRSAFPTLAHTRWPPEVEG